MNNLLDITNAADRAAVAESNFQILDASLAFALLPTPVNGVPNTITGPPTVGTFPTGFLWVDQNFATFRCTAGGTPGTWLQIAPAVMAAGPGPAGAPNNYWILITGQNFAQFYWQSSTNTWQPVFLVP